MINTIFYYPQSLTLELYRDKVGSTIADRTIVFAEDQKAIYKGGVKYGVTSVEDLDTNELKNKIQEILRNNPSTLPIATTSKLGGIIVGNFLDINTANGKLGVDISALFSNSDAINAIKSIINPAYIISNQEKLQPATDSRLGGIIKGNYLSINESGKLDVDLESVISAISGNNTFISFLNGRTYTLPTASANTKGGIKIGNGLSMNGESLNIDIQYIRTNIGSLPLGSESQQLTSSGTLRMYFLNIASGSTPSTVSTSAYQSGSDIFVVGQQTWTRTNTNPSSGQDTYALWAWFVDGNPISIEGPVRIYRYVAGGQSSTNGEDSEEIEWIYARFTSLLSSASLASLTTALSSYNSSSKISSTETIGGVEWTNHPTGIDTTYKYEYASYRPSRNDANGNRYWGAVGFSAPVLWAAYGERGTDGDGVEYIYYKGTTAPSGNADPSTWAASLTEEYTGPQNYGWTDDPSNLTTQGEKQWVSVRKKQNGLWGTFSSPALWGYFAQDGIVDGYTVDLTNENMPVGTDASGNISSYTNTCGIQVFHNGSSLSYTSSTPSDGYFSASVGTITRSDSGSTSGVSASISSGTLSVTLSNITGLVGANIYIPIIVTLPSGGTRNVVVTVFAVNTGEAGAAIDLYTSAAAIRTNWEQSVTVPTDIEVGVKISSSSGISTYLAGSTYVSNNNYSFRYHYDDSSSWTTFNTNTISSLVATSSSITILMLYNGYVIDQETIPFVRDGRPGISGATPISYQINVQSSGIKTYKSNDVWKFGGSSQSVVFNITKREGTTLTSVTSSTTEESVSVEIGGVSVTPTYSNGAWTATVTETNYVDGTTSAFTQILLKNGSNTVIASAVIPFIVKGETGASGSSTVLSLSGTVMRFKSWDSSSSDVVEDGSHADTNGITYLDVVYTTSGAYYRLKSGKRDAMSSLTAPETISGSTVTVNTTDWIVFTPSDDTIFQNIIAKNAFIQNLSGREIVITDSQNNPVAGITSGTAVAGDGNALTGATRGSVRIWAGNPTANNITNLTNCPFYVTDTGEMHATDASIKGQVQATTFSVLNGANTAVEITTYQPTGAHSGYTNLASSGLSAGDPVALVYDTTTHQPAYFFDFAPLTNTGVTTHGPMYFYTLKNTTGAAGTEINSTRGLYYDNNMNFYTAPEGYSHQKVSSSYSEYYLNLYIDYGHYTNTDYYAFVRSVEDNCWFIVYVTLYKPVSFSNGVMTISNSETCIVSNNTKSINVAGTTYSLTCGYLLTLGNGSVVVTPSEVRDYDDDGISSNTNVYGTYVTSIKTAYSGNVSLEPYDTLSGDYSEWGTYSY